MLRTCLVGFVCLLLAGAAMTVSAQRQYFRRYTAADGLSQAVVQALYQDRTGYVWAGTQAGLNRYDGSAFTVFSIQQGLGNDSINAITEDPQGRLWLATLVGASVWDGHRFRNYTTADGLAENRVTSLVVDRQGVVWCATPKGISRFDGQQWRTFTTADGLPSETVNVLLIDQRDRVWAGTSAGLAYVEGEQFTVFDQSGLQGKDVRALTEDKWRRLWVGMADGVRAYEEGRPVKSYTQANGLTGLPVVALRVDRFGVAWVGTPQGLASIQEDRITYLTARHGLQYSDVRSLMEDRDGVLWIGTYGGLYKFQGRAFTNYGAAEGLGSDNVRPILRDRRGDLWVGTTGGLSRFDGRTWRNYTVADGLSDNQILCLLVDRQGWLWIGTRAGLTIYNGSRFIKDSSVASYGRLVGLLEDRSGTMWMTFQPGGLFKRIGNRLEPVQVEGQTFSNARMLLDRHGNVWVSGDNGLSRWDGASWRTYTTKDGLADNQGYFLAEDKQGHIWMGYHSSRGLSRFDGSAFQHYTSAQGLANDAVFSIGVDNQGNIWVGTARGVDRFDVNSQTFTNYGVEEGFADNEANAGGFFAEQDGTLWFATVGGLSHYDPRFDLTAGGAPPVLLAEARLGDQVFSAGTSPTVGYQQNDLAARVVALAFANEKRLSFQYRLLGFRDEWSSLEGREVRFTNLPPGQFTLEVRARKYQGAWSPTAQFAFTIRAPFWRTWWFQLLVIVAITTGIFKGYRYQTARVRRRAEELEQKVAERTKELAQATDELKQTASELSRSNAELQQFAYVASHDLQEPLRMVMSYLQLLSRRYKGKLDEDADEFIHFAVDGASRMQGLINDLLAYSRVGTQGKSFEPTDCEMIVDRAISNLQVAIQETGAVVTRERMPKVLADPTQLVSLFQNLIGNAIKYRQKDRPPEVHIGVEQRDGEWRFFIRDNGIGIDKKYWDRVFVIFQRLHGRGEYEGTGIGLAVCKKIVERHGGHIWVDSEPGRGSTFYFTMPKNDA